MRIWALLALLTLGACGNHASPAAKRDAGAAVVQVAELPELPARPLGLADLGGFAWRSRAGQPAFRAAQAAEAAGDWPGVVRACTQALAADPGHLDAAWLLAIARAKTGALDEVMAPLALAAAGDYGKWAVASLTHPALRDFLATPAGAAWRRRVEADRATYLAALARSIVVRANGDLFAFDAKDARWYRLTRTNGHVIAALPAGKRYAYVTRRKGGRWGVGAIDLDDGHSTHDVPVGRPNGPLVVADLPQGFWVGQGPVAWSLTLDGTLLAAPKKPSGPELTISTAGSVRLARLPVPSITADWDDQALASAIRLQPTSRVVSVASPGLIAGNTITWSPDRSKIAFVAQLSDQCAPHAPTVAAFVADAATGTTHELARATTGLAIDWVDDHELAIAGDGGVSLVPLGTSTPIPLTGTTGLAEPMFVARCAPPEPLADGSDDDDPP
ncbi:MAG TPA: hypothetical protein VGG74_11520 [Kofleriaceae bacterium]|jgi:hypothetical protein